MSNEKINTIAELVKAGLSPKEAVDTYHALNVGMVKPLPTVVSQTQRVLPDLVPKPQFKPISRHKSNLKTGLFLVTVSDAVGRYYCWLTCHANPKATLRYNIETLRHAYKSNKGIMDALNVICSSGSIRVDAEKQAELDDDFYPFKEKCKALHGEHFLPTKPQIKPCGFKKKPKTAQ